MNDVEGKYWRTKKMEEFAYTFITFQLVKKKIMK